MKRFLIIVGVLMAALFAAAIIVPYLIPTSVYKTQIENAASQALDRDVTLSGDPKLSILPVISARIDGVAVANPDGFSDPFMIEAGSLQANVKLLPLLSQRVEISKITLDNSTVRLERLADGRANWEFGSGAPDDAPEPETGSGGFETGVDQAGFSNTAVYYNDRTTGDQYALTEFNATGRMTALNRPLTSSGDGKLNGQPFEYRIKLDSLEALGDEKPVLLDAVLDTIYGEISYDGAFTLADVPTLEGNFDVTSDTIGQVLTILGDEDFPILASALESIKARGTISGPAVSAMVDFATLDIVANGLDLSYQGKVTLGEVPSLDGTVDLNAAGAQQLLKPGHALIPVLMMLGNVDLTATLSGSAMSPSLTGITMKQRGQHLSTDYSGNIAIGETQALSGALDLRSDNPRAVLAALGTDLPEGDSLNNLAIKGQTEGTLTAPRLNGAELTLDETTATGSLGADLNGSTPRVVADLTMNRLDLTPFLGSGSQQQDRDPSLNEDWDDTPLDLAALKAINATVTVNATEVIMDQIILRDALLRSRLDDGRLSAIFRQDDNAPGFKVFQGNWSGDLVLDASRSTPTLELEALADSIAAQDMLTSLTGFKNLSGLGDVRVDLSSEGNSLKALVNGLDGTFETDLNDGALQGVNLTMLVQKASNLQDLLGNGGLTIASFQEAFSPSATTDFTKFLGNLDISNGVATLTDLNIDNPVIGVFGSGQIDLGARTLDIRLTPRLDVNAAGAGSTLGLGDIPIPVRVYGSWSSVRFGLDSGAVQTELTSRLRAQAASELANRIGGDAGSIIGEIVGSPSGANETETSETPRDLEDELRDRALGALFGNRNQDKENED
ncbi:MAG: AsmA family protein [Pseudomonadota bacterium]